MIYRFISRIILVSLLVLVHDRALADVDCLAKAHNILDRLSCNGLKVQRGLTGVDAGEAASYSLITSKENKAVYTSDFALIWRPPGATTSAGPFDLGFQTSIDGKLASDDKKSEDALRFRLTMTGDTERVGVFDQTYSSLSLKYETDGELQTKKLVAEYFFTPTVREWGMGKLWPVAGLDPSTGQAKSQPWAQFLWRPYVGLDAGQTIERAESTETKSTVLRPVVRGRATIRLNAVAEFLDLKEVSIFADNTLRFTPLESDKKSHNYLVAGIQFFLTEKTSLGLTYKEGEDAPKFQRIQTIGGSVGIRF